MLRAKSTTHLGNTNDADLVAWSSSVAKVEARYRQVEIVVPGHGEPGGADLLTHTRGLLNEPK